MDFLNQENQNEEDVMSASQKKEAAMTPAERTARSIIKKFKKGIWRKFTCALNEYHMIEEGDVIAVPVDGDIRSCLLALEFAEISKHGIQNFTFKVILTDDVDPSLLKRLGIESEWRCSMADTKEYAVSIGCNKITSSEDYDDVIESLLYGMLQEARISTVLPVEKTDKCITIRPLYLTNVDDLKHWVAYNELPCKVEEIEERNAVRKLIAELAAENKYVPTNIFRSAENVNLATLVAYTKDGVSTNFLEGYEE